MKSLFGARGLERTGAFILGGVDCHRIPSLSSRPLLPYLSPLSGRSLVVVRFRVDLGKIVRLESKEAHWHTLRRLKDLTNSELALTELDIFRPVDG